MSSYYNTETFQNNHFIAQNDDSYFRIKTILKIS